MPHPKKKPNPFSGIIQESGQGRIRPVDSSVSKDEEASRQAGRRSRTGYTQVAGYVPADLYRRVKKRLLDEERNFSELLEEWMTDYAGKQLSD